MKRQLQSIFILLLFFVLSSKQSHSQQALPPLQWAQHYGGKAVDVPFSIKYTTDGGTIIAGYTTSKDGDVRPQSNRDYWDLWVLKLSSCGVKEWELSLGGTGYETARDIVQTSDGGFLVLGETNSTDGGVVSGYGATKDIWLVKLSPSGTELWQKRYGGSGLDIGNHLEPTSDGGFLIAATSTSNDGDIKNNHTTGTYTDGVLMKVNASGNLQWSKCFGGTKNEEIFDVKVVNGTIYAAGFTNSVDGDIPPSQKNYDVWLLAIDANQNKIFSKIYGGTQNDVAYCMTIGADKSITMAGYTTSNDGDVSGAKGSQDFWILNVSQQGKLNWQKTLGGSDAEYAKSILTDRDSCYIIGGISYSMNGDISTPHGDGDFWTVKLSPTGKLVWEKSWGGSDNDHLRSMVRHPSKNEIYLCGDAESGDGDFNNTKGEADFAVIKLKMPELVVKDSATCNVNSFIPLGDTLIDACGFDSLYVQYRPVPLGSPFEGIKNIDTIFAGESLELHACGNGTIVWHSDFTLSCTDCINPIAKPSVTTIYTATNASPEGCIVAGKFTLVVLNDASVNIPTAFTPNGDGLNDFFGPLGKVPASYQLQIYNRGGEVVFRSSNIYQRWDGTYNGKAQPVGAFIYLVQYKDMQNQLKQQKGTFVLIR